MGSSQLRRRTAMSIFTVCATGAALLSGTGMANAAPGNDGIAAAQVVTLSASSTTFTASPSNSGATADDANADGALYTTDNAEHTLWYKFAPSPGRVSVTVSSADIATIVAGVVVSASNDSGIDGSNDSFGAITDPNVKNTDHNEDGVALTATTGKNDPQTFSFTADPAWVADAQHDYYLGVGTIGDDDTAPTGTISISITYTPAPANDGFANATAITASTTTYTGNTTGATPELDASGANIDPYLGQTSMFSVWYKYAAPSNGSIQLSTFGSSFSVVWEVCTSTVPSVQDCVGNDVIDSTGGSTPKTSGSFTAVAGVTYYVFLDGAMTTSNYNASGAYTLHFSSATAPSNDDISTPTILNPSGVDRVNGTNVGATAVVAGSPVTQESDHGLYFNNGQQHSVWYRYKPNKSAHIVIYTTGSLNTDVEVFRGSLADGFTDSNYGNDDYSVHRKFSRFGMPVSSGGVYYIGVDGSTEANYPEGPFGLELGASPANDNFSGAAFLAKSHGTSKASGSIKGSTEFATFQKGTEKSPKSYSGGADVWYTFVAPKAKTYTFTETLAKGAALIAAYSGKGSDNFGMKLVKDATHPSTTKSATITLKAKKGQKFKISIDGSTGEFGSFTLKWK